MAAISTPAAQIKERLWLTSTYNARDLGGYRTANGRVTGDRFLRSDRFVDLTEADRMALAALDVRTVIDLRNANEREKVASGFADCEGVTYHILPLFPEPSEHKRSPHEGLTNDFKMSMLYIDIVENRRDAVRAFLEYVSEVPEGRILFHCSAGKDRTGVLAMLLLKLAGVDDATTVADYALTEVFLAEMMPQLRENSGIPSMLGNLADEMLGSRPANMEHLLAHLYEHYGSVPAYLRAIGVSEDVQARIADAMTTSPVGHKE